MIKQLKYLMDDTVRNKLREVQISILDEIVRICEENGLRYCLTGGTCLGAIRHEGYIPWDDDIDIVMPRADFQSFIKITTEAGPGDFFLDYYMSNPRYGHCFAKYCKSNTLFIEPIGLKQAIYVDIYVQDKVPSPSYSEHSFIPKLIHKIDALTTVRREGLNGRDTLTKVIYYITRWVPVKWLFVLENKLMMRFENTDCKYYLNFGGSPYHMVEMTIPISDFEPYVQKLFEGKMYNVPKNWDLYLTRGYGDYMTLPPENQRVTHYPKFICFDTEAEESGEKEEWTGKSI